MTEHLGDTTIVTTEVNNSGRGEATLPEGVAGWSWGAFLMNWMWAIPNRVWIGLLALIPYAGLIVVVYLGYKGRELAWKNKRWESVEHFQQVQRRWAMWGWIMSGIASVAALFVLWQLVNSDSYSLLQSL